jgi:tetratricopeptide (TPR) repeat protein
MNKSNRSLGGLRLLVASFCAFVSIGVLAAESEVVFKDKAGRILTQNDLRTATGKFDWEIRSPTPVPAQAQELHQLGRRAGQRGQNDEALKFFAQAAQIAPTWPHPVYDAAFTHLLKGQFDKAYELYRQVDGMAPRGFFTVKTAVHSLKLERDGVLPVGTYLRFLSLEWTNDEAKKQAIIRELNERSPAFAPAWKARAMLESDTERRLSYLERGLGLQADAETKGFLLLNKAAVLAAQGKKDEAVAILGTLALDPASPLDIEALAKKTLATIVSR